MKDYYGVLGLTRGAGEREIKAAYRKLYDQRLEEQGEKGKQTERKQTERKQRGMPGEKAGPMPDMDAFERFFGFQAGKGMETYHPKGDKGKKTEGAVNAEELFASFFGKIGR